MPARSLLRLVSNSLSVFLFAAITFCSTRAHAQNRTPDSVVMKDGEVFRGTLELAEVDSSFFKMTLADGKVITIPSSEVVRIERVVPDDPERSVVISDDGESESDDTGDAHVTFIADDGVTLEQRYGSSRDDTWHPVCHGKCSISLPIDASYRVGGGGIRTSGVFRLIGKDGDRIVVRAHAHSRGQFALGITMVSIASLSGMIGLAVIGNCQPYSYDCHADAGAAVSLVSAVAVAVGIALIATNPSSKVSQSHEGSGSFLARAIVKPSPERAPAIAASHALAPSFVPAARTSTLFTIHF
jgi:hypothetical protein